ncbi:predicted protein [Nematostella vectensis]|uniref:Uncharacterized protein n=1 Tax=Nematostella vectensis TaxID=45351 RepID=A7RXE2_NEMVE|nr:predicted protein [Nematostella vectensis]|eukprot:XP_001635893.1 predicted protein [Nematostella vectensis]
MATSHICSCFGNFGPRYKRLVDNIFPADARSGLVKANMDKLIFYALSSPEKLDRIGTYLARKLTRFVDRKRYDFVRISMEALDLLLMACHAPSLNLFVESFLRMVQKLLESPEAELQVLGTSSFVKFANIEEDTPSYHRRYDFFVSKFSAMCWNDNENQKHRQQIRTSGLRGLQGVVRKTVSDDLQVNLWDNTHISKIVPSLLFILEESEKSFNEFQSDDDPAHIAEACLRELMSRASFGNIKSVINPVLNHLNSSELWVPNEFALKVFKIIMFSVQNQYNYVVIQMLLSYLDASSKESAKKKAGVVSVLAECVGLATGSSIGPAVLEVFNTLLRHLRYSVDARFNSSGHGCKLEDEMDFEQSIVHTIGAFAALLPDFQKTDVMLFIMDKFPHRNTNQHTSDRRSLRFTESDVELQKMLLHSLRQVSVSYNPTSLSAVFSPSFMDAIFHAAIVENPEVRQLALEVIFALIDRHNNSKNLGLNGMLKDGKEIQLNVEKCPKQDLMFFQKYHDQIIWYLYESASMRTNNVSNILAIYVTMATISTEMSEMEVISQLVPLVFGFQNMAMKEESKISTACRCALHAVVAAFLILAAQLLRLETLSDYAEEVYEMFKKAGCDYKGIRVAYEHQELSGVLARTSSPESIVSSVSNELDGQPSSGGTRPSTPMEHITFQILKGIISDRQHVNGTNIESPKFAESSFNEIADIASYQLQEFNSKLDNVLEAALIPLTTSALSISTVSISSVPGDDTFELKFPQEYIY